METEHAGRVDDSPSSSGGVLLEALEQYRASAFMLAGGLMIASGIVPLGLSALTDWAWASGIILIGGAVLAGTAGLVGLYPQTSEHAPRVAGLGAVSAGIAAVAALNLIVGIGLVLVGEIGVGTTVPKPVAVFVMGALSMAGGLALALLMFGIATSRTTTLSRHVGHLLVGGGMLLLLPVVVETLGLVSRVSTPAGVLFPILGVLALVLLRIGHLVSQGPTRDV